MNENEYHLYEMKERRNDMAASYDKPIICPKCGSGKKPNHMKIKVLKTAPRDDLEICPDCGHYELV